MHGINKKAGHFYNDRLNINNENDVFEQYAFIRL